MTNEWACLGLLLLLCLPQSTAKWLCSWVETPGAKCRNVLFPVHQGPLRVLSGPTHLDQSHSGEGMHLGLWWRVQNKHPRTPHQASCSECRRVMQLLQESCLGEKKWKKGDPVSWTLCLFPISFCRWKVCITPGTPECVGQRCPPAPGHLINPCCLSCSQRLSQ